MRLQTPCAGPVTAVSALSMDHAGVTQVVTPGGHSEWSLCHVPGAAGRCGRHRAVWPCMYQEPLAEIMTNP
jgi:hypothetical protein